MFGSTASAHCRQCRVDVCYCLVPSISCNSVQPARQPYTNSTSESQFLHFISSFLTTTMIQRHSFTALNSTFFVDAEYDFVKELGQGAYGCVVAARHRRSGEGCAIKKITNINTKVSTLTVLRKPIFIRALVSVAYLNETMPSRDQVCLGAGRWDPSR